MNCANHADASAVAYCRTCGKALCANCTRPVKGVIYCENCLAERMAGVQPQQTVYPPPGTVNAMPAAAPVPGGGPSPGLAGVLSAFFPFGVGAVYCGQYAKGLAHLVIFGMLVAAQTAVDNGGLHALLGISLAFFYVYQIVDAVRSAKAVQMGQPAPDPFGLARAFSTGDPGDAAKVPTGAIVLIGLGVLFLLHTVGIFEFGFERFWPLILIFLGGWMFAKRWGIIGSVQGCSCARCRAQGLMWPSLLVTVGLLFLFDSVGNIGIHRTWPVFLLVIGGVKLLQSNASTEGHVDMLPMAPGIPPSPPPASTVPPTHPSNEVQNG